MWIEEYLVVTVDKTHEEHEYAVYIVTADNEDDAEDKLRQCGDISDSEYVVVTAGISPDSARGIVCRFSVD